MRPAKLRRGGSLATPFVWLVLVVFAAVCFALYELLQAQTAQKGLTTANRSIAKTEEERETLKKQVKELQARLEQLGDSLSSQKSAAEPSQIQPQSQTVTTAEAQIKRSKAPQRPLSISLLSTGRLMTYRPARTSPKCDLTGVYQQFRLFGGSDDMGDLSTLDCKVKSANRHPTHGSGVHCWGRNIAVDPSRIRVSLGGEDVQSVMGRSEEEETAAVLPGLFSFARRGNRKCDREALRPNIDGIQPTPYFMPIINSLCGSSISEENEMPETVAQCRSFDDTPTIIVHRYEYVNLFHTATELMSAYVSLQTAAQSGLIRPNEPVRILVLDGHAKGTLDEMWSVIFNNDKLETWRMGQLNRKNSGLLCLSRVVFSETGYAAEVNIHPQDTNIFNDVLSIRNNNANWCVMDQAIEFGDLVAKRYVPSTPIPPKSLILFIARDRSSIPAHPRVNPHAPLERGSSAGEVAALTDRARRITEEGDVEVRVVMFSGISLRQQIELIRSASAVISVHGAALTHLVWARPETLFVELSPPGYEVRMHFPKMAARGGKYLARIGNFVNAAGLNPDQLEALVNWSLLSTDEEKLRAINGGGLFL